MLTVAVVFVILCCTSVDALCGQSTKVLTSFEALVSSGSETASSYLLPGIVQFHTELDITADGVSVFAGSDNSTTRYGVLAEEFQKTGGSFGGSIGPKPSIQPTVPKTAQYNIFRNAHKGEFTYVVVSTTAEEDFSTTILQDPETCVRAVFLQMVNSSDYDHIDDKNHNSVFYYHTAAGAALTAVKHNVLSVKALHRVVESIKTTPQWTACTCSHQKNRQCERELATAGISVNQCQLLVKEVATGDIYLNQKHAGAKNRNNKINVQQTPAPPPPPPAVPGFIPPPPPGSVPIVPVPPAAPVAPAAAGSGVFFVRASDDDDSDDEDNDSASQANNDPDGTDYTAAALLILAGVSGIACLGALGAALACALRGVGGIAAGGSGISTVGSVPDYGYDPSYASSLPGSQFSYF